MLSASEIYTKLFGVFVTMPHLVQYPFVLIKKKKTDIVPLSVSDLYRYYFQVYVFSKDDNEIECNDIMQNICASLKNQSLQDVLKTQINEIQIKKFKMKKIWCASAAICFVQVQH